MTFRLIVTLLTLVTLMAPAFIGAQEDYPAPEPPEDTSEYGKHFQRSMTLMATSTPEDRNTVRILYYGQSIMGQNWSEMVDEYLREKYPHTDFVTKNLAIGGFSSPRLVRTMHYDVFPFYPDLLVFHVYGAHDKYEEIIREVRRRTTAEIIMQSDHANKWPDPKVEGDDWWQEQTQWGDKMNYFLLPRIAEKYGCAFQPQRWEWVDYLKNNDLEPPALLRDGVHLNEHGRWLMAELLKRFLVYLPDEPTDEWEDLVTTDVVGEDLKWDGNRLRLEFEGNRVVALAAPGPRATAEVLIDGKKPSEFPECYTFTRPSGTPHIGWPSIRKITWQTPPAIEQWTATCTGFNDAADEFEFTVEGSVTGPDGSGVSTERFVSDSGRIVIEPEDWVFAYDRKVSGKEPPEQHVVRWRVEPMFVDEYTPPQVEDTAKEYPTVLASDLPNTRHVLELVATGEEKPAIEAIRVHTPPLR
ncbi:MAG: SGNH/GDSL hydrolase family protein [Candidatus Brocadiia bacterium]